MSILNLQKFVILTNVNIWQFMFSNQWANSIIILAISSLNFTLRKYAENFNDDKLLIHLCANWYLHHLYFYADFPSWRRLSAFRVMLTLEFRGCVRFSHPFVSSGTFIPFRSLVSLTFSSWTFCFYYIKYVFTP